VGTLAGFSVRQEGDLTKCDRRGDTLVSIIDTHNAAATQLQATLRKKVWWEFGRD